MSRKPNTVESILSKVKIDSNECWIWPLSLSHNGYGLVKFDGKMQQVHRLVYKLLVGPIPDDLTCDHLCRVRNCCNPAHIDIITRVENTRRGNVGKWRGLLTHCKRGHEYSQENTYTDRNGYRVCNECRRISHRRRRQSLKKA